MSAKIAILSYDFFFKTGLQKLTESISIKGISCTGNILIVDLMTITSSSAVQGRDFCHVIYIISEPATLHLLSGVVFEHDAYFLMRNATVERFLQRITALVISIMQKKCYWTGVRKADVGNGAYLPELTSNEIKFLAYYKEGMSVNSLAILMKKASKTIYGYRSEIMFKLKIKSKVKLARVVMEVDLIKGIQTYGKVVHSSGQSELHRHLCRRISTMLIG